MLTSMKTNLVVFLKSVQKDIKTVKMNKKFKLIAKKTIWILMMTKNKTIWAKWAPDMNQTFKYPP